MQGDDGGERIKRSSPKRKSKKGLSPLESLFDRQIEERTLSRPSKELAFHEPEPGQKKRRWRFDRAWPELKLAVEIEGGTWLRASRHTSGAGFHNDTVKYNTALVQGWRVLRFTSKSIRDGSAIEMVEKLLGENE